MSGSLIGLFEERRIIALCRVSYQAKSVGGDQTRLVVVVAASRLQPIGKHQ
jgi:hypothetical protein